MNNTEKVKDNSWEANGWTWCDVGQHSMRTTFINQIEGVIVCDNCMCNDDVDADIQSIVDSRNKAKESKSE